MLNIIFNSFPAVYFRSLISLNFDTKKCIYSFLLVVAEWIKVHRYMKGQE